MALSDLAVFSEELYSVTTEILDQQVEMFNEATRGGLVLASRPFSGDYSETAFFARISGLVRRRNPYSDGAITTKSLQHIIDTMVKVAAGTYELRMDPGQFNWIKQNPEVAAATYAKQLAPETMADMLNLCIGALGAALSQEAEVVNAVYNSGAPVKLDHIVLNNTVRKFGDAGNTVLCWLMHSSPMYDLYGNALTNASHLFNYGSVNIVSDAFGRVFCITDSPALIVDNGANPDGYRTIGLTSGAAVINMNDDYDSNTETRNGNENIQRSMQSEWTYGLGIKGFAWDKDNGGKAPTDAAVTTASNWDRYATSHKDLAGVLAYHN